MNYVMDGGGGGTTGRTVKVSPEDIEAVVRTVVKPAYDKVVAAMSHFENTPEGAGAFGGSQPGQALANLHTSVKGVFTSTVSGVSEDIDTFGHNLSTTARNWGNADQTSAERAQALASHLGGVSAASTEQGYDRARQEQGQRLAVDPTLDQRGDDHAQGHGDQQGQEDQNGPGGAQGVTEGAPAAPGAAGQTTQPGAAVPTTEAGPSQGPSAGPTPSNPTSGPR